MNINNQIVAHFSSTSAVKQQQQVRSSQDVVTSTFPEPKSKPKLIEHSDDSDSIYGRMHDDGDDDSSVSLKPIDYSTKKKVDHLKDVIKSKDSGIASPSNFVDGGVNHNIFNDSDSENGEDNEEGIAPRPGNLVEQQSLDEFVDHVNEYWHCKVDGCSYSTNSKQKLSRHLLSHTALKPFLCTWTGCGYACKRRSLVYQHVRVVHFRLPDTVGEAKRRGFVVDGDPKLYLRVMKFDLVEALRNRSTDNSVPEKRVREVVRHQSLSKSKTLGLNCPECSELLTSKEQLDYHLVRMHRKLPYQCMVRGCNAEFNSKSLLLDHDKHRHTEWACSAPACGHKATSRARLLSHFNCYHQKGRYLCGHCSAEFDLKHRLYRHVSRKCKWDFYTQES